MMMAPECVAPTGCTLGTGPLWSPSEGLLWWVDTRRAKLHRYNPKTGNTRRYDLPIKASALVLRKGGLLLAGDREIGWYDPATEAYERLATLDGEPATNCTSDGGLAPDGSFWFGTIDENQKEACGNYYRFTPEGSIEQLRLPPVLLTHTLRFSPDGRKFYTCDTAEQEILSFDYDRETGGLSGRKVLATTYEFAAFPQGSAIDSEGGIWICLSGGSRIARYLPSGKLDRMIVMAAPKPTNLAFGGPDLKTLFITTSRVGMSFPQLDSRPLSGSLFAVQVNVAGLPAREFGTPL